MSNEDVLKLVAKRFPTCTLIDATDWKELRTINCDRAPVNIIVGETKKKPGWDVNLCTGRYKVYVLTVTPRSENAE